MQITVSYNKNTNELDVVGDIDIITLNTNALVDTDDVLEFEIAVNTTQYELQEQEENIIE